MTTPRDVAVLVGSLRRESFSRRIASALAELAPPALRLTQVEIGGLPFYNQDLEGASPPAAWTAFRERLRAAEAVVFVTPEYNRSVPAVLKNAIDVGSRPREQSVWAGKPAGVIGVSPGQYGAFGANHHLRQSLVFLDMPALQQPEAYVAQVAGALDPQGQLTSQPVRDLLRRFGEALAAWIERIAPAPAR